MNGRHPREDATSDELNDIYASVLHRAELGLMCCDLRGRISLLDRGARALLEIDPGDLFSQGRERMTLFDLLPSPGELSEVLRSREGAVHEVTVKTGTRQKRRLAVTLAKVGDGDGDDRTVAMLLRALPLDEAPEEMGRESSPSLDDLDPATRKAREMQLRLAARMEAVGTLAGGVAHEINNPINVIMNYAELLPRFAGDKEKVADFSEEILSESQRIADIVKGLLAFARLEPSVLNPTGIKSIVESATRLMAKVLSKDQIALNIELVDDLPEVECQSQQVLQVLVNLLTNARDALNQKYKGYHPDKIIDITGEVVADLDDPWIRVTVKDFGIGIPSNRLERVFDPFYTSGFGSSSTGLGLSVSRGIIEEHRGSLTIESKEGEWTAVHLNFPVTASPRS